MAIPLWHCIKWFLSLRRSESANTIALYYKPLYKSETLHPRFVPLSSNVSLCMLLCIVCIHPNVTRCIVLYYIQFSVATSIVFVFFPLEVTLLIHMHCAPLIVFCCILLYFVVSYCILLYPIVFCCILLYFVVSYCILLYFVVSYCIFLYPIVSYCILLYPIVSYKFFCINIVS